VRIAYITSFFPPDRVAGAELGTHFMAEFMAKCGHEVHVIITRPKEKNRSVEQRSGYSIHWLNYFNFKGMRFFSEIRSALKLLCKIKPDLVHANCLLPAGYIAAKHAQKNSIKSIVLCYGYDVTDMSSFQSLWGKYALSKVQECLAASNYTASQIKKWVPDLNPGIFYAGYDDSAFPLNPLVCQKEEKKLLFIGRLIPEKGFDFLIKIMDNLDENYTLTVLGKGEFENEYKSKVEELCLSKRIQFSGHVNNDQITKILKSTHALILPSRREPFGVVCIEAIASGVPVVCSDVMGLKEAVCDGENGIVMQGFDLKSWKSTVERICCDDSFSELIYSNAQKYHDKWKWSTRLAELENLYHTI
jgi:glycosyltransferase involved in cell wall biosynthesis